VQGYQRCIFFEPVAMQACMLLCVNMQAGACQAVTLLLSATGPMLILQLARHEGKITAALLSLEVLNLPVLL
jgi:hypothetical protein